MMTTSKGWRPAIERPGSRAELRYVLKQRQPTQRRWGRQGGGGYLVQMATVPQALPVPLYWSGVVATE